MNTPFDRLPALAAPFAEDCLEGARLRRTGALRFARGLVGLRRMGVLADLSPPRVAAFAMELGLSATEARELADLGIAVSETPGLADDVASGETPVHGAEQVGRVAKNGELSRRMPNAPADAPPVEKSVALQAWRQEAKTKPAEEVKTMVDRGLEQLRAGKKAIVTITLHVTGDARDGFSKAREIASRKAKRTLSEGETFAEVVEHYLDDFDADRVEPGIRRMPDTQGLPGRTQPADVKRRVLARNGGRCAYPGCRHRIWIEMAHRFPHAWGGCREAWNEVGLCRFHHRAFDAHEFFIEGPSDAPVFLDVKRRRIGANGRVVEARVEEEPGAGRHAPP